jgi:hypothetical protein
MVIFLCGEMSLCVQVYAQTLIFGMEDKLKVRALIRLAVMCFHFIKQFNWKFRYHHLMDRSSTVKYQNFKIYIALALFFTFFISEAKAQFGSGSGSIDIAFSPSVIERGQTSRLTWSANFFSNNCQLGGIGITPIGRTQSSGSITVSPTSNAEAFIFCDNDLGTFASATLTVTEPATSVSVTTSFSPSTVNVGSRSTFRWSSTGATSCSSNQLSISGTSGSRSVTPSNTNNVPVTVTCTGNGNTGSSTSTLTVLPPLPTVTITPFPIFGEGLASATYTSTNATSCSTFGGNGGTSGTSLAIVSSGGGLLFASWSVTCTGPGGSTTGTAFATGAAFSNIGPVASLQDDMIVSTIDEGSTKQSVTADINNDGVDDLIVVDLLTQHIVVLITGTDEQEAVSKMIRGVSDITQLNSVSMSIDGDIVVSTTREQ